MAKTNPTRIHLKGPGRHEEAVAAGAITPGHLLQLNNAGKVVVHATSGGYAERIFALEDALQGKTISDAYASGDLVGYVVAPPGDEVYAFLADGESVVIGDQLVSNGDGTLQKLAGTEKPIAIALEAKDLSESSNSAAGRIRVRVL